MLFPEGIHGRTLDRDCFEADAIGEADAEHLIAAIRQRLLAPFSETKAVDAVADAMVHRIRRPLHIIIALPGQ